MWLHFSEHIYGLRGKVEFLKQNVVVLRKAISEEFHWLQFCIAVYFVIFPHPLNVYHKETFHF